MPNAGFSKNLKESPVKTVSGVVSIIAVLFGMIWGINANIVFKDDITGLATTMEVKLVEEKIIAEVRHESAKIRIVYLHDLEARLEDVEVEIDELVEAGKNVPASLRRSARRLSNRIQEISGG